MNHDEDQEEVRVRQGGRRCSLFLHRLVLVARLVSLSCLVSRERASYLHLFGLSSLELGSSLCR